MADPASIRVLDELTASRIAAGEVVERPASIVKELVENSLDAGARSIRVEIAGGGRRMVRVSDDGCGIPGDEVELAFGRHATSKLRDAEDLATVSTLGFRGEALASIAAVCQVTMVTRSAADRSGVRLRLESGRIVSRESVGAPVGTIVTAENLFHALPARLKFLRSESTESGRAYDVVTRYAMAYPERRLSLSRDGRLAFASNGSGSLSEVLAEVYGPDVAGTLVEIGWPAPGTADYDASGDEPPARPTVRIRGLAGPTHVHRATRQHVTLLVNGRWVQDASLVYAVVQAYHGLLPTGRYPLAVVRIEVPSESVDVNVHPAKTEIRLRDARPVFEAVQRAVRGAVSAASGAAPWSIARDGLAGARPSVAPSTAPQAPPRSAAVRWRTLDGPAEYQSAFLGEDAPRLPVLRVIGQLARMYIVAEGPSGLYVVDQHAAHERVVYERLAGTRHASPGQALLVPETVALTPSEMAVIEENLAALASVGLAVEPFGPDTVLVRAVPEGLATSDVAGLLRSVADVSEEGGDALGLAFDERLARAVCKRATVKAGQLLDMEEMRSLVRALESCDSPGTCPHGRPTMIVLDEARLAHEFRRA